MSEPVPGRNCDIVMKGGITSGVVYPLAIAEIAKEFRFKNVGGTSAGAIAAALTAAAEYSRLEGNGPGFERLVKLPDFLAGKTGGEPNLLNLFPPARSTRRLFAVVESLLANGPAGGKIVAAVASLLAVSPLITSASFVPAILLPFILREGLAPGMRSPLMILGLIVIALALVLFGVGLLVLGNAVRALMFTLPRNRFGFSTGRAPDDRTLPGVSEWLHDEIQATAGRSSTDPPLTFGDLWLAGTAAGDAAQRAERLERCDHDPGLRSINLQMITTALTHGHPYRLPFENRRFAFRASELRDYFPDAVVAHMVRHTRESDEVAAMHDDDLFALPEPWDLPIAVAARMSLSFPILFCMVPLYAVDYTRTLNADGAKEFDRCWFIDGGLSSNFPLNLFDSPLPRWPTFGINLDDFHPDHPKDPANEENNVWMPAAAGRGTSDHWLRFPDAGGAAIGGYLGAILNTIRNWHDNTQMAVPGFRDRIVHVKLSPGEGGLNLDMDPPQVRALSERGMWAGRHLLDRFGAAGAAGDGPNWNTHRWTRYRTTMALLQKMMGQVDDAFAYNDPLYPAYGDLVGRTENKNPRTDYWWRRAVKPHQQKTSDLLTFARSFSTTPPDFDEGAPNPRPELRISPKL
jgi:hypothetical protein